MDSLYMFEVCIALLTSAAELDAQLRKIKKLCSWHLNLDKSFRSS